MMAFILSNIEWFIGGVLGLLALWHANRAGYDAGKSKALQRENELMRVRIESDADIDGLGAADIDERLREHWRR